VTPVSVGSCEPVLLQGDLLADHELLYGTREMLSIRGVGVGAHELERRLDLPGLHAEDAIQVVRPQDLLRIGEKLPAAGLTDALRISQQPLQPLAVVVREMRIRRADAPL
jgi:hypothetical protein